MTEVHFVDLFTDDYDDFFSRYNLNDRMSDFMEK